ncbi:hypothetical protein M9Y10_012237 [Tritrichomonas musculus]|uniref:Uncharacterized protein n=1 Tax=Tritrichomonas musculus TaxID=1915356 RepID=A0ABR2ICQ9_9EUKA
MLFIDYLVHGKELITTISNYFDFYQISEEFELTKLNETIQSTKNSWDKCEPNLYLLNDPKIKDKRMIEQTVSPNLDEYVNNYGSLLMTVDIQSLLNIFNDPNKKFTEHNKAYTLIKQCYEDTMNESVFILLSKIDGNKLNESYFEGNILNQSSRFGYMAQINLNYYKISREFQKLIEINQKQEEVNKKLNSELNEVNKKLSLIYIEFESYKNQKEEVFKSQERKNEEQLKNNQKVCDEINVI